MITGIFPSRLKYTPIKPIFKNGDKKKIANYRPISLLPSFSEILEKNNVQQTYELCGNQ